MTTKTSPHGGRAPDPLGAGGSATTCSLKGEQVGHVIDMRRMAGLDTAATMLGGKGKLADAIFCGLRNVQHKVKAGRGISNLDLNLAASALDERAEEMLAHARKLRTLASPGGVVLGNGR